MDRHLRAWLERTGVTRAETPGLLVATAGSLIALVVALRLPIAAWVTSDGISPASPTSPTGAVVTPAPSSSPSAQSILVHVTGAVRTPGLVTLVADARVADAVAAAGGLADEAAVDAINLARPVVDGEHLHAPTIDEVAAGATGPAGSSAVGTPTDGRLPDGRLDLNSADAAELEQLPGVGPVLAGRIVTHREQAGPFDVAAALREVSGIGESTWAGLRELVGVAGEAPTGS